MPKGEVVEITFALTFISALLKKGRRLRFAIVGADKDTFAKLPANANPTIQLHRSANFASMIQLPVMC